MAYLNPILSSVSASHLIICFLSIQGSEAETIVYVLASRGENWQHVYTAVTRGQKRVYVVGRKGDLKRAIEKKITPRNTRLRGHVKEIVAQQGPENAFTQSGN